MLVETRVRIWSKRYWDLESAQVGLYSGCSDKSLTLGCRWPNIGDFGEDSEEQLQLLCTRPVRLRIAGIGHFSTSA